MNTFSAVGLVVGIYELAFNSAFMSGTIVPKKSAPYTFSQATNAERQIPGTDDVLPIAYISVIRQGRIVARLRVVMKDCALEPCWNPGKDVDYSLIVSTTQDSETRNASR